TRSSWTFSSSSASIRRSSAETLPGSVAEVRELQRQFHFALLQHLHDLLEVVALLAGHAHLFALNRSLYFDFRFLDELDDLPRGVCIDAVLHDDLLAGLIQRHFGFLG